MGRKVIVDKAQHGKKIMATIEQMRNEGDHCDFTIKAGNEHFRVHRNIISAGSEYFRAMLRHETLEAKQGEVEMIDMDPDCLKCCIDFIYTAEFEIRDGKSCDLLHAANIIQLDEVRNAVLEELENKLAVENFFETRKIARLFNIDSLLRRCESFKEVNSVAISSQSDFQNESKNEIFAILNSKKLLVTEKEKIEVLINWVGGRNERKSDLLELLKSIDLKKVQSNFMENLIEHNPLISSDLELYKVFNNAVKEILRSHMDDKKENDEGKQIANVIESETDKLSIGVSGSGENEKTVVFSDRRKKSLQCFDPKTNKVTTMHHETEFLHSQHHTLIYLDSYIYLLCKDRSVHRFDWKDVNGSWKRLQDMKYNHGSCPPTVAALGSLFVIGSDNMFSTTSKRMMDYIPPNAERFDTASGQWMRVIDRPQQITNSALVSIDRSIYCMGGWSKESESNSFWRFNPLSSEWLEFPPMRNAKMDCRAVALNQQIMVFGGCRHWKCLKEAECFNLKTSQWSVLPPMSCGLRNIRVCHVDGWIYAAQCYWDSECLLKYDVKEERWQELYIYSDFSFCDIISIQDG